MSHLGLLTFSFLFRLERLGFSSKFYMFKKPENLNRLNFVVFIYIKVSDKLHSQKAGAYTESDLTVFLFTFAKVFYFTVQTSYSL